MYKRQDQVVAGREDRIVELAFFHESMRYSALRQLVLEGWHAQEQLLESMHRQMGSACPAEDALLTSMLFRQWEQSAVMSGEGELDEAALRRSLQRHFSLCFGLAIEAPAVEG